VSGRSFAFPLAGAERLPLFGEAHPLRREFARWMLSANAIAIGGVLVAGLAWWLWSRAQPEAPPPREVHIVRYTDLGVPPSISRPAVPQVSVARAVAAAAPALGVPEPVPDELAEAPTIASVAELSEALAPVALDDLGFGGSGEPLVVGLEGAGGPPSPGDFVTVEEEPVRISIDPPVFPQVAKDAEVGGTVLVRVLVGKNGRVKEAIVVEGHAMLVEAALASARTAVFRPALQRHRPVEVWVMVPITFRLN
jgi:TonB family protein